MQRSTPTVLCLAVSVALLAVSPRAAAGDFWDFLQDAWAQIQAAYFDDTERSADTLKEAILNSAAQSGSTVADPAQYDQYARKLAKTLSMLSAEQQNRIFENL